MNLKRWWIGILGGGTLGAGSLGALIFTQYGNVDATRAEVATLKGSIDSSRKQIEGTRALEREVIVLREINEVMKGILPDNDDVNNLVRTLQRFSEESHVRISGLKKKNADSRDKGDFEKVGYTISLDGDAFQLLDFLNMIESHSRFMRVPNFRISAAQRTQLEKEGVPAHKIQMDVETFVYDAKKDSKTVKIDGYDRKRDLLLGEIQRRRQDLSLASFSYRGTRGRRDPWIDPRVPLQAESKNGLPVQEQMEIVQKLYERTQAINAQWSEIEKAENVIEQMLKRSDFDAQLAELEEQVRRVQTEKSISYIPSQRRLQTEIVAALDKLRGEITKTGVVTGPTENQLREIEKTMLQHMEAGEYKLVLEAHKAVEKDLALAEPDPLRKPLVDRIRDLEAEAHTVLDFEKIEIKFGGRAIVNDEAIAVINNRILGVGDMVNKDLIIHAISRDEIEFLYRGIVFARRY